MKRANLCVAFVALLASPALAADTTSPSPPVSGPPLFLEFFDAPAPGEPLLDVPRLMVGVGRALRRAVVDTGSTGVVLSASSIPGVDRLPSLGPGTLTYSSSGRIMTGRWVVTRLTIAGRTGHVTTQPIAILAVDAIDCTIGARRCTPSRNPAGVAMLGIGFGREHDRQSGGTPDRNPLLNLAGVIRHAYTITRRGITIGGDAGGFATVRLKRDTAHNDWVAPGACVTLGGGAPSCGTVLVDTGITGMFLTVPPDRLPVDRPSTALPDGTPVAIELVPADSTTAATGYVIRAGERADVAAPTSIILAGIGKRPTFVNTGVHLLNRFDYRYDADAGIVGYRPVTPPLR